MSKDVNRNLKCMVLVLLPKVITFVTIVYFMLSKLNEPWAFNIPVKCWLAMIPPCCLFVYYCVFKCLHLELLLDEEDRKWFRL